MRPQSAKAKGRRLQQWVRDKLIEHRNVHPEDIESILIMKKNGKKPLVVLDAENFIRSQRHG
jgi:hypothetical protein